MALLVDGAIGGWRYWWMGGLLTGGAIGGVALLVDGAIDGWRYWWMTLSRNQGGS